MPRFSCILALATLLSANAFAQADDVSAPKLAQALGVPGLQAKAVPKRRAQQVHQDYDIKDAKGRDLATVTLAPPATFADWKLVTDFEPVSGLGLEAYQRPRMEQVCALGSRFAACLTLMPMASFPKGKPSLQQIKAALESLI